MTRPLVLAALVGAGFVVAQVPPPLPRATRLPQPTPPRTDRMPSDAAALAAAGLTADDPAQLLAYVRLRTLSPTDLGRIRGVIRRFAEDDFDERLKAATEAERFGPAAIGPLREAEADPDPEIAYRATETLKRLEKVPHAAVSLAAVRGLARLQPPDAAAALLKFLPMADDEAVADAVRAALVRLAVRGGGPEPALVAGLADPNAVCRAAAAVALVEGGPVGQRVRIPDALPKVWAAVTAETDPDAKFQMAYALLTVAREKPAVAAVIDMIPDLPRGRLWQAEDLLLQLAGPAAPKVVLGKSRESLAKGRAAWAGWWAKAAAGTDLAAFRYAPRIAGRTLLVLADLRNGVRGDRNGVVLELGPDQRERWRIAGLATPIDARMLPDGTVVVAEQNSPGVTVRDTGGRVLATRAPAVAVGPNKEGVYVQQVQPLPNGNLLLVGRNAVVELEKDTDRVVMQYARVQHDVMSARRLADGATAVVVQNASTPFNCLIVGPDGKPATRKGPDGKAVERRLTVGPLDYRGAVTDAPADGRLLVTEQGKVTEYDPETGKVVWDHSPSGQPRSVQRLPNGNTLLVTDGTGGPSDPGRVVEVTPDGDEVWAYQLDARFAGLVLAKAYRR
jgi:hypothetical protein